MAIESKLNALNSSCMAMPNQEISLFKEFFAVIKGINDQKLRYAIIGGIAMAFPDKPRFTKDIDILLLP